MESLALIVSLMLLAELILGATVLTFNIVFRVRGKFAKTTLFLLVVLAIETAWALSILPAFGYPSLAFLLVAALLRFLPNRKGKK